MADQSCAEMGHKCCMEAGTMTVDSAEDRAAVYAREFRAAAAPVEENAAASVMHGDHVRVDPDNDGDCDACPEGDTDHDYWNADGTPRKPLPGFGSDERALHRARLELLSVTQAERDKAHAAGNSLPDKSYPINNVHQLHSAAVLAASHHGDWKAAKALIRRRAKELGVDVNTLPGFGDDSDSGSHSARNPDLELLNRRRSRRGRMLNQRERRARPFAAGSVELRARPDGTGGTAYEFRGYGATFDDVFQVWDQWGEPYDENLAYGGFTDTLRGKWGGPDTRFFIGHNEAGIALARTAHGNWPGTMRMSQDSHGLEVSAPGLDGRNTEVRNLASAVERGDMDGMSVGYMCRGQEWNDAYTKRTLTALDLHNGDVSVVAIPANPGTKGTVMIPLSSAGGMRQNRPGELRAADDAGDEIADVSTSPDYNEGAHGESSLRCTNGNCSIDGGALNAQDAKYCDQCGEPLYNSDGLMVVDDSGVVEEVGGSMADADLLSNQKRRLRLLEIA